MVLNPGIVALAALVPLILGFIWYHPKLFGKAWMKSSGLTEESMKGANMTLIFGLTFLFSFIAGIALTFMVIHQNHIYSILMKETGFSDPASEINLYINSFMEKYGRNFRTWSHGIVHGIVAGLFFVLPLISINSLFERRGFKYIAITVGFWTICLAIMGGIICAYS